jgi:hypothetical protein
MRSRRTLALLAVAAAVLGAFTFAQGASAANAGGCQLKGTASFSPGLSTTSQPFSYSFGGDLTAYVMPSSTGTGGCASSTTQGLAVITWADGTRTLTQYSTSGAAAAVKLDGTVVDSTTLQPVDPLDPPLTVTTTRYNGDASHGLLAFEATPTDCQTGVTSAGIEGFVGLSG